MLIPDVIADQNRYNILLALRDNDITAHEIAERMGLTPSAASYQIRQMISLGIMVGIRSDDDARNVYFRLNEPVLLQYIADLRAAFFEPQTHPPVGKSLLFVCRANSARSQMAAAWAHHVIGDQMHIRSAGVTAERIHPHTVTVMAEVGIDLRDAAVTALADVRGIPHIVVSVCDSTREICAERFPHTDVYHWSIPDPAQRDDLDEFRAARDTIKSRVVAFATRRHLVKTP